jgi:transcription elongation factor Elf1
MKKYNVTCPICGTVNKNLYLEETDGWMECEKCHNEVRVCVMQPRRAIPVYTPKQLASAFTKGAPASSKQ